MHIDQLDFAAMYREHMTDVGRLKRPEVWDARADQIAQSELESPYALSLIDKVDLTDCQSLLDVGCGTGLITLRLAPALKQVFGLDYSPRMLHWLSAGAQRLGMQHVVPILQSWDDDWRDIPCCDIVIASRSTAVRDMASALHKLHSKAKRRVYLTSLVGGEFASSRALRIMGRDAPPPLPDYRYVINILAQMGIHPRVDYIAGLSQEGLLPAGASVLEQLSHRHGPLNASEVDRVNAWLSGTDPVHARQEFFIDRWAVISWERNPCHQGGSPASFV